MEVIYSLTNKCAVYCGFLNLLYQVEQVLFFECWIFLTLKECWTFIKLFFSMPVEVILFFFQDLWREVIFLLLKVNLVFFFYHFRTSLCIYVFWSNPLILPIPLIIHPHPSQSHALFCKACWVHPALFVCAWV